MQELFTLEFTKEEIEILADHLDSIILNNDFSTLKSKETHKRLLDKWAMITGKSYL